MRKFLFIVLAFSMMSFTTTNSKLLEIADVLKVVETNNNPDAIGDSGKAFGVLQIHEACVLDVNKYYGTSYTHEDTKLTRVADDVFIKYISLGIKLYKKRCGNLPSDREIVRMWNGGIYRGYEYPSTRKYLKKYLKVLEDNKETYVNAKDDEDRKDKALVVST